MKQARSVIALFGAKPLKHVTARAFANGQGQQKHHVTRSVPANGNQRRAGFSGAAGPRIVPFPRIVRAAPGFNLKLAPQIAKREDIAVNLNRERVAHCCSFFTRCRHLSLSTKLSA